MKLSHLALGIAGACLSLVSLAATVNTSSSVTILAVDGEKAGSILKNEKSFDASANEIHQVVVRVADIIRSGSDRRLYESKPIVVKFTGNDEDLVISAPNIRNESDVKKFEKNPVITLATNSGTKISTTQEYLVQEGLFPDANLADNLSDYNTSGGKAAVASFAITTMPVAMGVMNNGKATKGKVVVQGENVAEQQLQYWFQQADKATQERFLKWAAKK